MKQKVKKPLKENLIKGKPIKVKKAKESTTKKKVRKPTEKKVEKPKKPTERKVKKSMLKKWRFWLITAGVFLVTILFSIMVFSTIIFSVSEQTSLSPKEIAQIRFDTDPIVENMLLAVNEEDYAKHYEYFTEQIRAIVPESVFQKYSLLIKTKIGDFVSKNFWKIEEKEPNIIMFYKANFTKEPAEVTVMVFFQKIEEKMYVSGFWLNSPKLQEL